jgi:integrase
MLVFKHFSATISSDLRVTTTVTTTGWASEGCFVVARNPKKLEGRRTNSTTELAGTADTSRRAPRAAGAKKRTSSTLSKATKPYPSFPLTPHRNGQYCKKIRGKLHYFGTVDDPDAALEEYHRWCDALHSGKATKVIRSDAITVADLANRFLTAKDQKRSSGDIEAATFVEYHRDCERFVKFFGADREVASITRNDLAEFRAFLAKGANATTLNNRIGAARSILKFAYENELIDAPIRFGESFKRPERRLLRRAKAQAGRMHFHADEIRNMLQAARPCLRAMILLGINCGLGNTDLGNLSAACIDFEQGRIDYPRVKTGIDRRCPLWPETIQAIRESNAVIAGWKVRRHASADGLLFVTRKGLPCVRIGYEPARNGKPHVVTHDSIKSMMQRVMTKCGITKPGLGFYGLRRSFETIGSETGNKVAVDHIMGHAPLSSDMGAVYRQHVADDALRTVTEHVRQWLWAGQPPGGGPRVKRTYSLVPAGSASDRDEE